MFSLTFVIVTAVCSLVVGYWARKYVEKKYPNEAAQLDAAAKKAGEQLKR